jgi:hypothetical protein
LCRAYEVLGLDDAGGGTEVFRNWCKPARIVEPIGKQVRDQG